LRAADEKSVSELFPLRLRPTATVDARIRLRCNACEVAWSGPPTSTCWVCDGEGAPVLLGIVTPERDDTFGLDTLI
jgi:hypothetical protein